VNLVKTHLLQGLVYSNINYNSLVKFVKRWFKLYILLLKVNNFRKLFLQILIGENGLWIWNQGKFWIVFLLHLLARLGLILLDKCYCYLPISWLRVTFEIWRISWKQIWKDCTTKIVKNKNIFNKCWLLLVLVTNIIENE
jgi:hypothetical protein